MIPAIKNFIHKLSEFIYSDFSDHRTELEKIIFNKDKEKGTPSVTDDAFSDRIRESLYIPPEEVPEENASSYLSSEEIEQEGTLYHETVKDNAIHKEKGQKINTNDSLENLDALNPTIEKEPKDRLSEAAEVKEIENIEEQPAKSDILETIDALKPSETHKSSNVDSLLEDLVNLVLEMDIVKGRLSSKESQDIIVFFQDRIIECMSKQPLEFIGDETVFNCEIHNPYPFVIASNGTNIKRCLRRGFSRNGKILIKAVVELEP